MFVGEIGNLCVQYYTNSAGTHLGIAQPGYRVGLFFVLEMVTCEKISGLCSSPTRLLIINEEVGKKF